MLRKAFYLFFSLKGRLSKADFWIGGAIFLVIFIISIQLVLRIVFTQIGSIETVRDIMIIVMPLIVFIIFTTYLSSSLFIKRLHDLGISGKEIGKINPIYKFNLIKRCLKEEGMKGENLFGISTFVFPELMRTKSKLFSIGFAILAIFIHVLGISGMSAGMIESNPLIQIVREEIISNTGMIERYGKDIFITKVISYSSSETTAGGKAKLQLSLSGNLHHGEINVDMIKNESGWKIESIKY